MFLTHKEALHINKFKTDNNKKSTKTMNKHIANVAIQLVNKHLKTCSNSRFIKGMQSENWGILLLIYTNS